MISLNFNIFRPVSCDEIPGCSASLEERRERKSDVENSEDERRRTKIGSLKKKALNASSKLTCSLKRRGKRKVDYRFPSVPIEDVRDAKEEKAVRAFRKELILKNLLPERHDDYHTMLRLVAVHEVREMIKTFIFYSSHLVLFYGLLVKSLKLRREMKKIASV